MNSNDFNMSLTGVSVSSEKLGVTTTVKEQVDNLEITIDSFKKAVDSQKKLQGQLQIHLKKLEDKAHSDYEEMYREIKERAGQLTETFRTENDKLGKQMQYLQLQVGVLADEHSKLNEISSAILSRNNSIENKVGV